MSSEKHPNLQLHKWAPTDYVKREEWNDNFGIIDDKIGILNKKADGIISVKEFGAVGDGLTDDTNAIQNAINTASIKGLTVLFPPGRYMITGTNRLFLKSNVTLLGVPGAIIDLSNRSGWDNAGFGSCIIFGSGSLGNTINLSADALVNAATLQVASTAELAAGDLILLTSNAVWLGDTNPGEIGELVTIKSVDSATQITLSHTIHENYLISDSARICKITPIENLTIEGLTFIGKGSPTASDNVRGQIGVGIAYGKNITIRDCTFKKIDQVSLELCSCYQFRVENCSFEHDPTPAGIYVQYQCRISSACIYGVVDGVNGVLSRHTVVFGHNSGYNGIARHIRVKNCSAKGTWHAAYSTHNSAEHITFENNEAVGCLAGFNIRDKFAQVKGNRMFGCGQGIFFTKRVMKAHITDNEIVNCSGNGIYMNDSDLDGDVVTDAIIIQDNYIDGATHGINLASITNATLKRNLNIKNNTIRNIVSGGNNSAIRISGKFTGQIIGNDLYNCGSYGIFLQNNANHITIRHNYIQKAVRCVHFENTVTYCVVRDNTFVEYTTAALSPGTGIGHDAVLTNNIDFGSAALT
jgi:polygalacturonase